MNWIHLIYHGIRIIPSNAMNILITSSYFLWHLHIQKRTCFLLHIFWFTSCKSQLWLKVNLKNPRTNQLSACQVSLNFFFYNSLSVYNLLLVTVDLDMIQFFSLDIDLYLQWLFQQKCVPDFPFSRYFSCKKHHLCVKYCKGRCIIYVAIRTPFSNKCVL